MRTYAPAPADAVLARLLDEPSLARGVVHHARVPARAAETAPIPGWVDPRIRAALAQRGIGSLYTHQAEALEAIRAGRDVCVVTPTASGQEPLLRAAGPPGARGRPIRPGALALSRRRPSAQDQVAAFRSLAGAAGLVDRHRHLRRRHAGADPLGDPAGRPGGGHEPGHAPLPRSCPTTRNGSSSSSSSR